MWTLNFIHPSYIQYTREEIRVVKVVKIKVEQRAEHKKFTLDLARPVGLSL